MNYEEIVIGFIVGLLTNLMTEVLIKKFGKKEKNRQSRKAIKTYKDTGLSTPQNARPKRFALSPLARARIERIQSFLQLYKARNERKRLRA